MHVIETVDSLKLAELLNNHMSSLNRTLNIMIQVNTSNEERKNLILKSELSNIVLIFSLFKRKAVLVLRRLLKFISKSKKNARI